MVEPKICKCGHDKLNHYKHPEKLLKSIGSCQSCPCTYYMNRRRPFASDKAFTIFGFVMIGLLTYLAIAPFVTAGFDLNTEIKIPAGTIFVLLGMTMAMFCCYVVIPIVIVPYFDAKKRKEFPISTNL